VNFRFSAFLDWDYTEAEQGIRVIFTPTWLVRATGFSVCLDWIFFSKVQEGYSL